MSGNEDLFKRCSFLISSIRSNLVNLQGYLDQLKEIKANFGDKTERSEDKTQMEIIITENSGKSISSHSSQSAKSQRPPPPPPLPPSSSASFYSSKGPLSCCNSYFERSSGTISNKSNSAKSNFNRVVSSREGIKENQQYQIQQENWNSSGSERDQRQRSRPETTVKSNTGTNSEENLQEPLRELILASKDWYSAQIDYLNSVLERIP